MSMSVVLYSFSGERNAVNKSLGSPLATLNCDLLEECNVQNPKIIVNRSGFNMLTNYVYISAFHRYYFVTDINILDGNRIQLDLKCDVLTSFVQPNRANIVGYVERSGNEYDISLYDDQCVLSQDRDVITVPFNESLQMSNWKFIGIFNAGMCNLLNVNPPSGN